MADYVKAVLLLAIAATSAAGQSVRIGGRCLPIPERDSLDVVLAARVRGQEGAWGAPDSYTRVLADEIRRRLRLPQPLTFRTYSQTHDRALAFPGGWGGATFALARDGSLAALVVDTTASLAPLDTAMLLAINAAATDSAFPPLPPAVANRRATRASGVTHLDTAFFRLELMLGDVVEQGYAVWGRARVPTFRLSSLPLPDRSNERPSARRNAPSRQYVGSGGAFLVVDDSGRVVPGSLHAIPGTNVFAFGEIARVAPTWRFTPGRIGDCPVAVFTRWEFLDR